MSEDVISAMSERSERVTDIISERMYIAFKLILQLIPWMRIYDFYSRGIIGVIVHGHVITLIVTSASEYKKSVFTHIII